MAAPTPYGYQPSFKERVFSGLSKNLPVLVGKLVQRTMYAFVALWRFLGELLRDAIGR